MIPKTIHYCWFGGNELPLLAKKCIKSWKKYCKGYKIIRWDESNFDISSAPLYVRQAYEAKKWAFVTDYVRLWAMTKFGGIYMDTDVEVVKPLDQFLEHQAFSGFESDTDIPTGIMACRKDFPLFQKLLGYYDDATFLNEDGSYNVTTNVQIITDECVKRGLKRNNTFQVIDGFALFPCEVFCPIRPCALDVKITKETYTIHWFAGSWLPDDEQKKKEDYIKNQKNKKNQQLIKKIKRTPNKVAKSIVGTKNYDRIRDALIKRGKNDP